MVNPSPFLSLYLYTDDIDRTLDLIDKRIEDTKIKIEDVAREQQHAVSRVVALTRMTWGMTQGMIRATGEGISITQRLVMTAAFGAIQTLTPVLQAAFHVGGATWNPQVVLQALLGLAEMGTAITAFIAFEKGAKQTSLQLRGLNFMLSNMSMMIGTFGMTK